MFSSELVWGVGFLASMPLGPDSGASGWWQSLQAAIMWCAYQVPVVCFNWFCESLWPLMTSALTAMWGTIQAAMPDMSVVDTTSIMNVWAVADYYLPLTESALMVGGLFGFYFAFLAFKYTTRWF